MGWLIRLTIGVVATYLIYTYHQDVISAFVDSSDDYYYDYDDGEPVEGDGIDNFAYDDFDTESDY